MNSMWVLALTTAVVLLFWVVGIANRFFQRGVLKAAASALADRWVALGASRGRQTAVGYLRPVVLTELQLQGRKVVLSVSYRLQNTLRQAFVLEAGPLPYIRLTREGALERLGKGAGMLTEVQTGHADFDDDVYVTTTASPTAVRQALASPVVRREALVILQAGCGVVFSAQGVEVSKVRHGPNHLDGPRPEHMLEAASRLADALPKMPAQAQPCPAPIAERHLWALAGAGSFALMAWAVAVAFSAQMLDAADVFKAGSVGAMVSLVVAAGVLRRWRIPSSRRWLLGAVAAMGVVGTPVVAGACMALNQLWDDARPVRREAQVTTALGDHMGLAVGVSSWRQGHTEEHLGASLPQLVALSAGEPVGVRVYPGALGWPWAVLAPTGE